MSFRYPKLGTAAHGAIFLLAAFVQPVSASPIYHLGPGAEYSVGSNAGTFIIPSVAQGVLLYGANDPPTAVTLTGLYNSDGEKVICTAVTRSTFACSIEGLSHDQDGENGWQSDGHGSTANGPLGLGNGNDQSSTDSITTWVANSLGDDPTALFQIANLMTDTPAPVPEPGTLLLFGSALLAMGGIAGRGPKQNT